MFVERPPLAYMDQRRMPDHVESETTSRRPSGWKVGASACFASFQDDTHRLIPSAYDKETVLNRLTADSDM